MDKRRSSRRGPFPGHAIKARIDCLSTGIPHTRGGQVIGTDLVEKSTAWRSIWSGLKAVPCNVIGYAELGIGGYYLEVTPTVWPWRA